MRWRRRLALHRRRVETIIERARFGVGEEDIFSFDVYLSGVIARALDTLISAEANEEGEEVLKEMQHGFARHAASWENNESFSDEMAADLKRSLKLLKRHYRSLWY